MPHYLITYDNKPPRNYQALYNLMKAWRAVRIADSVWLADLVGPAATVRSLVMRTLQRNDAVAVIELKAGSDWATANSPKAANIWLATRIRAADTTGAQ